MSDERRKVRDLAQELKKDPKEVLAVAKELGIVSAKVATSSLNDSEYEKLRNHFSASSQDKPNVVVRRRKESPSSAKSEVKVESNKSKDTSKSIVSDEPLKEDSEKKSESSEPKSVGSEKKSKDIKNDRNSYTTTRIISKKEEVKEVIEESPKAELEESSKVEVDSLKASENLEESTKSSKEQVEEKVSEAKESVKSEKSTKPQNKSHERSQDRPNKSTEESPKARVIRPATFSAEPDRDASGSAVSSAPVFAAKSDEELSEDKPESSSSQVRVISRPSAPAPNQGARADNKSSDSRGQRQGQDSRVNDSNRGNWQPKPGGSARVEVSTPFEPVSENDQSRKKRNKGKRTVDFENDLRFKEQDDSGWSKPMRKKNRSRQRESSSANTQPMKAGKRVIKVEEFIKVADLAHQMGLKASEIVKVLFSLGVMATINQSLDVDTATLVANEFEYEIEKVGMSDEEIIIANQTDDKEEDLVSRPPVVTIMGHVDHGKTSLLDAIRMASVVKGEAGGITQHIGAYHVTTKRGDIVFLDTPGHEAFTAMRARGAEVTDIVILVVAADDGVMEQTREAVSHARAANVPIMVAVNKMDKPEANPERVMRELSEVGLVAEDWGGDTTFSYVSAKTGQGLDELLDLIVLQSELLELKANPNKSAIGHVVEAKLDKGRGALGTVLIQQGTLRLGDAFVCGVHSGKVRAMFNDQGKKVKEAGPSMPVEVQGFEGVPEAGQEFVSLADEKVARRIAEMRNLKQRERELAKESKITLETFLAKKSDAVEAVNLNLVVKSDVQGSLEAISDALHKMSTDQVKITVVHGGTGAISESDVLLASATNSIIIGFNVRPTSKAKELAEAEKIDMHFYDIIYKLVEEIKSAMEGMLAPVEREVFLGTADVREVFSVPKVGSVAGCYITDGKVQRNSLARLLRDGVVIYTGKLSSLRRFKDDVREVSKGYECGIGLENYNDIKAGDSIEAYEIVEEAAKLK